MIDPSFDDIPLPSIARIQHSGINKMFRHWLETAINLEPYKDEIVQLFRDGMSSQNIAIHIRGRHEISVAERLRDDEVYQLKLKKLASLLSMYEENKLIYFTERFRSPWTKKESQSLHLPETPVEDPSLVRCLTRTPGRPHISWTWCGILAFH
jgi:hypothetical protein